MWIIRGTNLTPGGSSGTEHSAYQNYTRDFQASEKISSMLVVLDLASTGREVVTDQSNAKYCIRDAHIYCSLAC